jgi:hypothetical protein
LSPIYFYSKLDIEQEENKIMENTSYSSPLLNQIAQAIRVRHYSIRTEAYIDWIKRFIYFHHKRHPKDMGEAEVAAFLTHLAVDRNVAATTQNQSLNQCTGVSLQGRGGEAVAGSYSRYRAGEKTEKSPSRSHEEGGG